MNRFVAAGVAAVLLWVSVGAGAVAQTSTSAPSTLPPSTTTAPPTLPPSTTTTTAPPPTTSTSLVRLIPPTSVTTTPEAPAHTVPPLPPPQNSAPPPPTPADLDELQHQLDAQARAAALATARLEVLSAEMDLAAATAAHEVAAAESVGAVKVWAEAVEAHRSAQQALARWATAAYVGTGQGPGPISALGDTAVLAERQLRRAYGATQIHAAVESLRRSEAAIVAADIARTRAVDAARVAGESFLVSRLIRDEIAARAEALASGSPLGGSSPLGPTILGKSVLTGPELAGWFRAAYGARTTSARVPIEDLARLYVDEGRAEGVRGDIAFAQAVLETGAFGSGHAAANNYSGIGAFDSCSPECGFTFATPELGVRAQIQLLRTYASPGLTSESLAHPPDSRLTPEGSGVRGCCPTWAQLTGVWATDLGYAPKVLNLFHQMLVWAIAAHTGAGATNPA